MRKKALAAGVGFAFISTMMLAQATFAAPPEKQTDKQTTAHGPPSKNTQVQADGDEDHKISICHNGHIISVDRNALPGHGIVEGGSATTEENSRGAVRGHKRHTDTLVSDAGIAGGAEGLAEGLAEEACQGESTQLEGESDEEAVAQEENEQSPPQGTTVTSQEARQGEQVDQAEEEVETCDGESLELNKEE